MNLRGNTDKLPYELLVFNIDRKENEGIKEMSPSSSSFEE
jgi:hypothetical protein